MREDKIFDFSMFDDRQLVSLLSQVYAEIKRRRDRSREVREKHPRIAESAPPARYRDPVNPSQTWSGRGPMPSWMRDALEAGHDLASLVDTD